MSDEHVDVRGEKPRSVAGRTITVVLLGVAVVGAVRAFPRPDTSIETAPPTPLSHERELELLGGKIETLDDGGLRVTCHDARDAVVLHILHLENFVSVNLSRSPASEDALTQLAGIGGLRALKLADTKLTDAGLSKLAALTQLESLDLSGTQIMGSGLRDLEALPKLTALHLNRTSIGDDSLDNLSQLTQLNILFLQKQAVDGIGAPPKPITDAGLVHLSGLRQLRLLDLRGTNVTNTGVADLQSALPGCRISFQVN